MPLKQGRYDVIPNYYLFNTPKQQWAKPKQYMQYKAKNATNNRQ